MKHTTELDYHNGLKDLINRLGYFSNKRNLSAREVSLRLGYTESWYYRVEAGDININSTTLFALIDLLEITPSELFYYDLTKYDEDKELLELIRNMSKSEKEALCQIIKMKK